MVLVFIYTDLHGQTPMYISDLLYPCITSRSLGSSDQGLLVVPCARLKTKGNHAFEVVAPTLFHQTYNLQSLLTPLKNNETLIYSNQPFSPPIMSSVCIFCIFKSYCCLCFIISLFSCILYLIVTFYSLFKKMFTFVNHFVTCSVKCAILNNKHSVVQTFSLFDDLLAFPFWICSPASDCLPIVT